MFVYLCVIFLLTLISNIYSKNVQGIFLFLSSLFFNTVSSRREFSALSMLHCCCCSFSPFLSYREMDIHQKKNERKSEFSEFQRTNVCISMRYMRHSRILWNQRRRIKIDNKSKTKTEGKKESFGWLMFLFLSNSLICIRSNRIKKGALQNSKPYVECEEVRETEPSSKRAVITLAVQWHSR